MNGIKRLSQISLLLLVVAASALAPTAASAATCNRYYTVQHGDFLIKLANKWNVNWRYLAEINRLDDPTRIYPGQRLCIDGVAYWDGRYAGYNGNGTVWASRVIEDTSVTITGRNLPADTRFDVILARDGNGGNASVKVGTAVSDRYGGLSATFDLPARLVDSPRILIRLRSGGRIWAENWFTNASSYEPGPWSGSPYYDRSLQVLRVARGQSVTIRAVGVPSYDWLDIQMANRDLNRPRWIDVASIQTVRRSTYEQELAIPSALANAGTIAIRVSSQDGSYSASTWFYNQDHAGQGDHNPFLAVIDVTRDAQITVQFTDLAAGVRYNILMGSAASRGVNGILVGTVLWPQGGSVQRSFAIPAALRGSDRLAVRLEDPASGFAAYNLFTNR